MKPENKKCKLRLKDVSKPKEPFEIRSLDKFREVGSYTWIAEKITDKMGFPDCVKDTDDCHCCEGQLFVVRHGTENRNQSVDSFGQVLTMINHETGNTNIFTRALHPTQNNGDWQSWQMVATGDPKLIAVNNSFNEVLSTLRQQVESDSKRIEIAEKSLLANATVRFDRIEENEAKINAGEIDSTTSAIVYYKPANKFVAEDNAGVYWDTWEGIDAYMSGSEIRMDKVYLCDNNVYIWDGIKFTNNQNLKNIYGDVYNNIGYLNLKGNISINENYKYSDLYPLYNNKIIVKNGYAGASSLLVAFYDENQTFISGINNATDVEIQPEEFPDGAAYVRFSSKLPIDDTIVFIQSINNQVLMFGSINKEVAQNKANIIDIANEINDLNARVADRHLVFHMDGYYTMQGLVSTENARNTGLIPFKGYQSLTYTYSLSQTGCAVSFFDVNKNLLDEISILGETSDIKTNKVDLTDEIYSNAYYLSVSTYDSKKDFTKYSAVLTNPESLENRLYDVLSGKDLKLTEYGYYSLSGILIATENAMSTELISIDEHEKFEYAVSLSTAAAAVCFFDASKQCITDLSIPGIGKLSGSVLELTDNKYKNAKYIAVSYYDKDHVFAGYKARLYNSTTVESRLEVFEKRLCEITNILPINNGIKAIIFGDSITSCANFTINEQHQTTSYSLRDNSNSYTNVTGETVKFSMWPALMTKYLSCSDIRNYAQSGASYIEKERESGNERQNLSYQIQLALNDISNPNGAFPTAGEFAPDIVIFALGTNDGTPNDTYEDAMEKTVMSADGKSFDVEATLDNLVLTNTCEAIRYAFLKIKQRFPYSLCLCVLPIQRADKEQPGVNEVLEKMAKRYSIKVIDGYSELGIVRDLEVNGGLGENLKDGLHPNDMGQKLYARMVVNAIKNSCVDIKL